jgi:hypothetical protein
MGRLIDHGWQKSAKDAAQQTGIMTGANLRKPKPPSKPIRKEKPDKA